MNILNTQVRDQSLNGKQLRRQGIIPAVLFGKHLEESISIQIPKSDVEHFLHHNSIGSKVDLMIGKKKYMALLKDVAFIPAISVVEHLSFQAMTAGEKITSAAHIVLHNKEKVEGLVHQALNEISYKAIPSHIFEKIEIDLTGMHVGDSMSVADLDVVKNKDIELLVGHEAIVFTISPKITVHEEAPVEKAASAEVVEVEVKEET